MQYIKAGIVTPVPGHAYSGLSLSPYLITFLSLRLSELKRTREIRKVGEWFQAWPARCQVEVRENQNQIEYGPLYPVSWEKGSTLRRGSFGIYTFSPASQYRDKLTYGFSTQISPPLFDIGLKSAISRHGAQEEMPWKALCCVLRTARTRWGGCFLHCVLFWRDNAPTAGEGKKLSHTNVAWFIHVTIYILLNSSQLSNYFVAQ